MDLCFGVIDSLKIKEPSTDFRDQNIISYYGHIGNIYGDGKGWIKETKIKPKEGSTVLMSVSILKGEIYWEIDGKKTESYFMDRLKDKSIKWVPFIKMYCTGDEVVWME